MTNLGQSDVYKNNQRKIFIRISIKVNLNTCNNNKYVINNLTSLVCKKISTIVPVMILTKFWKLIVNTVFQITIGDVLWSCKKSWQKITGI